MSKLKKIVPFNVDAALDTVDLTFKNYTPTDQALEFFALIRVFQGRDFEVKNSKFHYFLVDLLFGNVKQDDFPYPEEIRENINVDPTNIAILSSRGSAKSSVTTLFYPIYCMIKGEAPVVGKFSHMLILSDTQQGGARDQAKLLGKELENSLFAQEWFEKIRCTESEIEVVRRNDPKNPTPLRDRHMLIRFKGAQSGGIRSGSRNPETGERYAIIIADDVIKNEAESYSPIIMKNVTTALESDALNAMRGKNTQFIMVNTPFHKKDPIYMNVESGAFTPLVTPICEKIYENMKPEEFVGIWPQMHDYESVMSRYNKAVAKKSTRSFFQELMLRISSEEDKLIQDDMINWYSIKTINKFLEGYNIFVTTDFTASNDLKGDFSVIMVWAVNSNDDRFLLDLSVKKQTIEEQYNTLMTIVQKWSVRTGKHLEVGIEIDGQQQLNIHALKELQLSKNIWFNFSVQVGGNPSKPGISRRRAGGNKHAQFMRIHHYFTENKIYFPEELKDTPDMKELLNELNYITYTNISSLHDDALDGISMMGIMNITLPSIDSYEHKTENTNSDIWGIIEDDEESNDKNALIF